MKRFAIASTLVWAALTALPAAAQSQFQTPESAIRYRQGAFSVMAAHFSRVAMMAQGIQPFDAKVAMENVDLVTSLSTLPFTAFGTGTDKGLPTRAKAEIWSNGPKFKSAADRMVADVAKLNAAAKTGNFDQIKTAVGVVGQSCKACHDEFRGQKSDN